jgi:hypothetical protein
MKRSEIAKKVKDLPGIPGAWPQWIFKAINEEFDSEFEKGYICYDPIWNYVEVQKIFLSPSVLRRLASLWISGFTWFHYSTGDFRIKLSDKKKGKKS